MTLALIASVICAAATLLALKPLLAVAGELLSTLVLEAAARARERVAGDLVLQIEEEVASTFASDASVEITARHKAARFLELSAAHDVLACLDEDERLALLHSTLPKLGLGAFADTRPRSIEVLK